MSATNRPGGVRVSGDFYPTPRPAILAVLPEIFGKGGLPVTARILEPCAGSGAVLGALLSVGLTPAQLTANELDSGLAFECAYNTGIAPAVGDWLKNPDPENRPDLILTNPPYSLAQEFAEAALARVRPGGVVALLLRLNWAGSTSRAAFHNDNPARMLILTPRPSFARVRTNGKVTSTDATEYAWFIWGGASPGTWAVADLTDSAGIVRRLIAAGFAPPLDFKGPPPPLIDLDRPLPPVTTKAENYTSKNTVIPAYGKEAA